jgi:hypothetical protein
MINLKSRVGLAVGTLATIAILTPTAAYADPPTPYAQAAAHVAANGSLIYGKNVVSTSSPSTGLYCVQVNGDITLDDKTILQATPQWGSRSISASPLPSSNCGSRADTITVWQKWALSHDSNPAAGDFYLSIH